MGRPRKNTGTEPEAPTFNAPPIRKAMRVFRPHPDYVVAPYDPVTGARQTYSLTPEGIKYVRDLAQQGVALGSIANALGIDKSCFLRIRTDQPEVQAAIDAGRDDYTTRIHDMLMAHAENGNVTALLFIAKCRAGYVEQEGVVEGATPKNVTNNNTVNIIMPPKMTDEQFAELRKLTAPPVDITPTEAKPLKVLK